MTIYEEPFGHFAPFSVGFDEMFKRLDHIHNQPNGNYPPYNIVKKDEDNYVIEIAVAGFNKKDFNISLEKSSLTVKADKQAQEDKEFLHQGIAGRSFLRTFALADHVKVKGAEYINGILSVSLLREIPEELKPVEIKVK
ncbi:MAG: Hsp20 family protein [Methylophagaceae bacterium]|jgi:molecular chaperone IbpA|tara:strand:- start:10285 stop:10701 length:417 start_codon:yes stop_codon:yes gene_type:complete